MCECGHRVLTAGRMPISALSSKISLHFIIAGFLCRVALAQSSAYYRLDDELFSYYKPYIRPVLYSNTTTTITLRINVVAINEVDEGTQVLMHTSVFDLQWRDEFLVWDPKAYDGVRKIELPADRVWLPKVTWEGLSCVQYLIVVNSACEKRAVHEDDFSFVVVHSTGDVRWLPQGVWQTTCSLDITYYPFDKQVCEFHLEMWTSPDTEVKLTSADIKKGLGFLSNSEWSLDGFEISLKSRPLDANSEEYSSCIFRFYIRRFRLFHMLTFLTPNVLLAVLAPLVFALPVETGEKMSFIMTLLLAFAVNLSVMMNSLPHSSLQTSVVVVYFGCLSVVTALSVMASVFLLHLYNRSSDHMVGANIKAATLYVRRWIGSSSGYKRNFTRVIDKRDFKLGKVSKVMDSKPAAASCLDRWDEADSVEYDAFDWKDVALTFDRLGLLVCSTAVGGMTVLLFVLLIAQP